ncbi:hypothetical protein F5X68DRAFT_258929 [Plectosphaerella plurivora]|uniref:Zn(2)-C6 fungal-type domain-containing protein n=1 Tax=Plectosphaerella plurivora TaxID=936078 RepID=A0A9P8VIJ7_9PEZI|nr:hypothetical protein F5X68DRAFT_258929 [Plectosphaerella plurivora]
MNRRTVEPEGVSPPGSGDGHGYGSGTGTGSGYISEAPSSDSSTAVMTLKVPVRSGRKGSKKVRTGCITCKIRRVKCDEAKPACLRCTKTGRKCDGYLQSSSEAHSSDGHSPKPPAAATVPDYTASSILGRTPSSFTGWEHSEQRAFHFYRTCSSTNLFRTATRGFWGRVVPGLCFQEPAIRHAAMVISDLHERAYHAGAAAACPSGERPGYPALSAFAAAHYGRAMRSLQGWQPPKEGALAGSASIAVPLLACALFVCVEFMVGNETVAQMHIQQGRQILASFEGAAEPVDGMPSASPGVELIRQELVPIFTRLSLASFLFGSSPAPIPASLRWTAPTQPGTEVHMAFNSASEAEQALDEIMEDGLRFSREAAAWVYKSAQEPDGPAKDAKRAEMEAMQAHLLGLLDKWHVAAAVRRAASAGSEDEKDEDGASARMSRLYYLTSLVFVRRALSTRQTEYDLDTGTFASIVATSGEVLDGEARGDGGQRFTFETGVIPPLYFAATRTRHPGLRRAAIAVLRRRAAGNCNENLWNARRIVHIAQRTAVMEEERAMELGFEEGETLGGGEGLAVGGGYGQDVEMVPQDFSACVFGSPEQHDEWIALMEEQAAPYREAAAAANGEVDAEEAIASIVGSVPVNMPPSIPRDKAGLVFGAETEPIQERKKKKRTDAVPLPLPPPLALPPWAADGGRGLRPPYNIPERARIKNAVISPQVGGGTWVTFFVAPEPGRGPHWGFVREFISGG